MALTPLTLVGHGVRLEALTAAHVAPLLAAAASDGSRASFAFTPVPADLPAMQAYVAAALDDARAGRALPFVTVDATTDRVVGATRLCFLERWSWPDRPAPDAHAVPDAAEIGWTWLAASAQRTSINTAAKRLMLGHAFDVWRVRRVTLKTDARNARSRAAIARLGAQFEGILRAHFPAADGGVRDSAMYSILAAEWPAVRDGLDARLR